MLNIPEEVKNLFRQDSINKNFRVHFPNGERADLVNKDIVSESVQFTESLCSQENLKFGLCEASVLEFETIGVGNIKGCEIEAGIEIDITSLGEEFIAEHGKRSDDVHFPFYYVPYGVFTVDSCKRQSNMNRRRVVAYTELLNNDTTFSEFEKQKQAVRVDGNIPYEFNIARFILSNYPEMDFPGVNRELITAYSSTDIDDFTSSPFFPSYNSMRWCYNGHVYRLHMYSNNSIDLTFKFESSKELVDKYNELSPEDLLEIKIINKDYSFENRKNAVIKTIQEKYGAPDEILKAINTSMFKNYRFLGTKFFYRYLGDNGDWHIYYPSRYSCDDMHMIIYPYLKGYFGDETKENGEARTAGVSFYPSMDVRVDECISDNNHWEIVEHNYIDFAKEAEFYKVTFEDTVLNNLSVSYPRVQKYSDKKYYFNPKNKDVNLNLKDIVNAYMELNGMFLMAKRNKGYKTVNIRNSFGLYPSETLYPSEDLYPNGTADVLPTYAYKETYLEEHEVQPIGKIIVNYKDISGNMQIFSYVFDENARNVYEIKDNFILNAGIMTQEQVEEILVNNFIPSIKDIIYTPMDLKMKGLPYLEAGDVLTVLTKESGFESFVLRRVLTGVQSLEDNIESSGDEVNVDSFAEEEN